MTGGRWQAGEAGDVAVEHHRKIRVMHTNSSRNMGGTERMLAHMLPAFDTDRFESCLACFDSPSLLTPMWKQAGVKVFHLCADSPVSLTGVRRLVRLVRRWRPDVLFSYGLRAGLMTRAAARWCGVQVVIASQQGVEDWKTWKHTLLERLTSPLVDLYIGVSQACCRRLATRERIPRRQLHVIPNGIDFAEPPDVDERLELLRAEHPFPEGAVVVGTVGRLEPVKGHEHLLAAAKLALRQRADLFFVLLGEDFRAGQLQEMARREGVSHRVYFAGYSKDVAAWLKRFDIFVLPSLSEGMPVAALEAMFMARPVVATAVGGTPEVVVDGVTGLLVPPADGGALAEKILLLADDPALRDRLGEAGRRRAQEHFRLDTMVRRYEDVIAELVDRKRPRGPQGPASAGADSGLRRAEDMIDDDRPKTDDTISR